MTKSITLNYTIAALVAFGMVLATATPAFAAVNSTRITINVTNRGTIDNVTQADSHTGANIALGSVGGSGGTGGAVTNSGGGDENNGGATGGNGGSGGSGGAGGLVQTGNASADAGSENSLNGTDVEVELGCDCGDINSVTVELDVDNDDEYNNINNLTQARGRTGENRAEGSTGGNGGVGGVVDSGTGSENNGGAKAGTGGAGGSGGLGGTVLTGNASSTSAAINLLNTTILRVRI